VRALSDWSEWNEFSRGTWGLHPPAGTPRAVLRTQENHRTLHNILLTVSLVFVCPLPSFSRQQSWYFISCQYLHNLTASHASFILPSLPVHVLKHQTMKAVGTFEIQPYAFTSALCGGEYSAYVSDVLFPKKIFRCSLGTRLIAVQKRCGLQWWRKSFVSFSQINRWAFLFRITY